MKRLKRQKHHNNTPQRNTNTTGGTRGWKKCPHPGCKFNTRSGHKLGQHIRRSHKEDAEAKEAKLIKEAIATLPTITRKKGRPKLHPSTMDSLDKLIISVKERLQAVEHKLGTFTLLQRDKAQLEHELNILTLTGQRLKEHKEAV